MLLGRGSTLHQHIIFGEQRSHNLGGSFSRFFERQTSLSGKIARNRRPPTLAVHKLHQVAGAVLQRRDISAQQPRTRRPEYRPIPVEGNAANRLQRVARPVDSPRRLQPAVHYRHVFIAQFASAPESAGDDLLHAGRLLHLVYRVIQIIHELMKHRNLFLKRRMRIARNSVDEERKGLLGAYVLVEFQHSTGLPEQIVGMSARVAGIEVVQEITGDFIHLPVVIRVELRGRGFHLRISQHGVNAHRRGISRKHAQRHAGRQKRIEKSRGVSRQIVSRSGGLIARIRPIANGLDFFQAFGLRPYEFIYIRRLGERFVIKAIDPLGSDFILELPTRDQSKADFAEPFAIHRDEPEPAFWAALDNYMFVSEVLRPAHILEVAVHRYLAHLVVVTTLGHLTAYDRRGTAGVDHKLRPNRLRAAGFAVAINDSGDSIAFSYRF